MPKYLHIESQKQIHQNHFEPLKDIQKTFFETVLGGNVKKC
jgi:hypothetical protein